MRKKCHSAEDPKKKPLYTISISKRKKDVVTGVVPALSGRNISINLGKADAILNESEQVKGEVFKPTERIKVYILE